MDPRQVGPAREHGQPGEELLLGRGEQPVGPVDRRGQALVPGLHGPGTAGQQPPVVQPLRHLGRAHRPHPRGGELDRQRQAVDAVTDLGHGGLARQVGLEVGLDRPRPHHEQGARLGCRQWRDPPDPFPVNAERLAAGGQDHDLRAVRHDPVREPSGAGEHVLAVVQDQQQGPGSEVLDHALLDREPLSVLHPERGRHSVAHRPAVRQRRELAQPDAVGEARTQRVGRLDGEPGLADPAHAGQRHQRGVGEQPADLGQRAATADEAGAPAGQVGDRLQVVRNQRRVLVEQLAVHGLGGLRRFHSQLVHQQPAQPPVDRQRVGLPPAEVERTHLQDGQGFSFREPAQQRLQRRDGIPAAAQLQQGIRAVLLRRQPQVVQPGKLRLHAQLRRVELGQGLSPPQPQRRVEQLQGPGILACPGLLPSAVDQPLELGRVELVVRNRQQVPGSAKPQPVRIDRRVECGAEPGDVRAQGAEGIARRIVPP